MKKAKVTIPGAKKKVTRPVKVKGPRPAKSYRRHRRFDVADVLPVVKKRPRGKPFQAGNPWRFPPGRSGNEGGRVKRLGKAYAALLAEVDPESGKTYAEIAAARVFELMMNGAGWAAAEYRRATEGSLLVVEDVPHVRIDR